MRKLESNEKYYITTVYFGKKITMPIGYTEYYEAVTEKNRLKNIGLKNIRITIKKCA